MKAVGTRGPAPDAASAPGLPPELQRDAVLWPLCHVGLTVQEAARCMGVREP